MQTTMLFDNGTTVDAYDFSVGKCLLDNLHRLLVKVGLIVGGHQYSTVNDQVVGVSSRQAIALVVDGAGQRQFQQTVRTPIERAETLQFLFHLVQVWMVLVASRI